MRNKYIPASEKMSPGEVLDVMRALYSDVYVFGRRGIMPETEVWDWLDEYDLDDRECFLNDLFGCSISEAHWNLLKNGNFSTLCEAISMAGAKRQPIEAYLISGTHCLETGAFLAVCSALIDAGVEVHGDPPSTPLLLHNSQAYEASRAISKLVPTLVLTPQSLPSGLSKNEQTWVLISSILGFLVCLFVASFYPVLVAALLWSMILYMVLKTHFFPPAPSYFLSGVSTLGDLARLVLYHRRVENKL